MRGILILSFLAGGCLAAPLELRRDTKTQTLELAPGGTIRIAGSHGDLNIEGWDRAEVQLEVTKMTHDPKKNFDEIGVQAERKSPAEVAITTSFPKRTLRRLNRGKSHLMLEYRIMVPRDAHLVIQQDLGMVMVIGVTGKVEARNRIGDIVVLGPPTKEPRDLRVRLGGVDVETIPQLSPGSPK